IVARAIAVVPATLYEIAMAPAARLGQTLARASQAGDPGPNDAVAQTLELDRARQVNHRLRQEVDRLEVENARLRDVRAVLGDGFRLIQARTAGGSDPGGLRELRIDRGSGAGVAERQVVMFGPWLVGRVVATTPMTARVQLIDSKDSVLEVRFAEPALGGQPRPGRHHLAWSDALDAFEVDGGVPRDTPVSVGDVALLNDPGWPREAAALYVGLVQSVEPHPADPDLRLRVVVRSSVSLGQLDRVDVATPREQP
ncbi:MAG: rod shape-determining protein MreC, partial [Planctomycetota bacterium]